MFKTGGGGMVFWRMLWKTAILAREGFPKRHALKLWARREASEVFKWMFPFFLNPCIHYKEELRNHLIGAGEPSWVRLGWQRAGWWMEQPGSCIGWAVGRGAVDRVSSWSSFGSSVPRRQSAGAEHSAVQVTHWWLQAKERQSEGKKTIFFKHFANPPTAHDMDNFTCHSGRFNTSS